jgi:hypothetical protein
MVEKKFIFVNGVMQKNPAYHDPSIPVAVAVAAAVPVASAPPMPGVPTPPPPPPPPKQEYLAVVSTMDDIMKAQTAQKDSTGKDGQMSASMISSMEIVMDDDYLSMFKCPTPLDGGELVEELSNYFAAYETPIGLLNKLIALCQYKLTFIVDDSGSMLLPTDVHLKEGNIFVRGSAPVDPNAMMTRWQEAENRLHIFIDIVSYVPTKGIKIVFLNNPEVIHLNQAGKSPQQFNAWAHNLVHTTMTTKVKPLGSTPTYRVLTAAFAEATTSPDPILVYLFTDGEPSDRHSDDVSEMIVKRPNPQRTPITFITCTDQTSEAQWMKDVRLNYIIIF